MTSEDRRRWLRLALFQSGLATVLIGLIGLMIGAFIAAPAWALPHKPTFATWKRQAIERNLHADTLIVGSSQFHFGINPKLMSRHSVNLGNAAQDIYYSCALIRKYADDMPNLKRVLLEVEIRGWQNTVARSGDAWRIAAYYTEFGIPPEQWSLDSTLELAAFRAKGPDFKKMEQSWFDDTGWGPREGMLKYYMGKKIARWHTEGNRSHEIELHLQEVERTIRELAQRGVELILVRLPAHQCYRDALDSLSLERMDQMTQKIVRVNNGRYLDYYCDDRFKDEHYFDPNHLNTRGAEQFTKILEEDLKQGESIKRSENR